MNTSIQSRLKILIFLSPVFCFLTVPFFFMPTQKALYLSLLSGMFYLAFGIDLLDGDPELNEPLEYYVRGTVGVAMVPAIFMVTILLLHHYLVVQ